MFSPEVFTKTFRKCTHMNGTYRGFSENFRQFRPFHIFNFLRSRLDGRFRLVHESLFTFPRSINAYSSSPVVNTLTGWTKGHQFNSPSAPKFTFGLQVAHFGPASVLRLFSHKKKPAGCGERVQKNIRNCLLLMKRKSTFLT